MALPKIDKPLFEMTIPSLNRVVKFRPFSVKEEKILLIAQQSTEDSNINLAIKQVISNCIYDDGFDVNDLATFDLEYMFLKLRAKSVNNIITVSYRDNDDDEVYNFEINLDDIEMTQNKAITNIIKIDDKHGIKMKYPSVTILDNTPKDASGPELVEYLISNCIDQIFDEDSVFPASDYPKEELNAWLEDLDLQTFRKIKEFFDDLPKLYHKIEYTNSKGKVRLIELTTLTDFFTWE